MVNLSFLGRTCHKIFTDDKKCKIEGSFWKDRQKMESAVSEHMNQYVGNRTFSKFRRRISALPEKAGNFYLLTGKKEL